MTYHVSQVGSRPRWAPATISARPMSAMFEGGKMRRLICLLAALATSVLFAQAALAAPQTLRYTTRLSSSHSVDAPPTSSTQTSPGDVFLFTYQAFSGRRTVGQVAGACTAITATQGPCSVTLLLRGRGTIQFAGAVPFSPTVTKHEAVVGGTGEFTGARGAVTVRPLNPHDTADALTIRLL